jgi:hypothetical protein
MGLKGYRLWVMGQLDSTCRAPPRHLRRHLQDVIERRVALQQFEQQRRIGVDPGAGFPAGFESSRDIKHALFWERQDLGVALQVAFERQTLKPVFHLIGYRLWV